MTADVQLAMTPLTYALALPRLPGVGRVATHRLLDAFPTLDALRATPREQVLHRLKGVPGAAALVATLFDDDALAPAVEAAEAEQAVLQARRITVFTPNAPGWPPGLSGLDRRDRPEALFVYGPPAALDLPRVALLGATGLPPDAFEDAQALVGALARRGVGIVAALATGFDVVMVKRAADTAIGPVLVAGCGLGVVPAAMRPAAMQAVQAGGALVSPFDRSHGPFAHDEVDRARATTGLAPVAVFGGAADGPEMRLLAHDAAPPHPVLVHPAVEAHEGVERLSGDVEADAAYLATLARTARG